MFWALLGNFKRGQKKKNKNFKECHFLFFFLNFFYIS